MKVMKKSAQDREIEKLKKQVEKLKKEKESLQRDKRNLKGRLSTAQSNNAKYRSVLKKKEKPNVGWRKRSIPTHSGWLYPLTFDAGKGLKEA